MVLRQMGDDTTKAADQRIPSSFPTDAAYVNWLAGITAWDKQVCAQARESQRQARADIGIRLEGLFQHQSAHGSRTKDRQKALAALGVAGVLQVTAAGDGEFVPATGARQAFLDWAQSAADADTLPRLVALGYSPDHTRHAESGMSLTDTSQALDVFAAGAALVTGAPEDVDSFRILLDRIQMIANQYNTERGERVGHFKERYCKNHHPQRDAEKAEYLKIHTKFLAVRTNLGEIRVCLVALSAVYDGYQRGLFETKGHPTSDLHKPMFEQVIRPLADLLQKLTGHSHPHCTRLPKSHSHRPIAAFFDSARETVSGVAGSINGRSGYARIPTPDPNHEEIGF
jgi:hypothetical protein